MQIHCGNFQSKVRYIYFDLNIIDVFVAEFQEAIRPHIPEIISFLSNSVSDVRKVGADILSKLSEQGKV